MSDFPIAAQAFRGASVAAISARALVIQCERGRKIRRETGAAVVLLASCQRAAVASINNERKQEQ